MQQVNAHHLEKHKPQICPVCGRTFALASSLIRHTYDHEEKCYKCETCNYSAHFESELNVHKIVHRKQPSFQCMVKKDTVTGSTSNQCFSYLDHIVTRGVKVYGLEVFRHAEIILLHINIIKDNITITIWFTISSY